jgi:hypothetical protein
MTDQPSLLDWICAVSFAAGPRVLSTKGRHQ